MSDLEISNRIERVTGKGGFSTLVLTHISGYSAVVSEYGAQVLSWRAPNEEDLLFSSEAALYQEGKPVRSGIPIVFPQFGKGQLPPHGFARIKGWKVVREQVSTSDAVSVTLRLTPDAEIEAMYPYPFSLEVDVVLTDTLLIAMRVTNTGLKPMRFTQAFHTYLKTSDISKVLIQGLRGVKYIDLLRARRRGVEKREDVAITEAVDRAYHPSPQSVSVSSHADGRRFIITKEGFVDTLIWNPWTQGAGIYLDLNANDYRAMVCVESGNVIAPITLAPGEVHSSGQVLRFERL